MDRCELAYRLHGEGFNCAQSVALAFADRFPLPEEMAAAAAGGLGGGVGGSHQEVCGAVSGGVLALGWMYPHTEGADQEGKRRLYAACREFRRRFEAAFGRTRCGDLLAARPSAGEDTAARRMGVTNHCDVMIVTAVEILEGLLAEMDRKPASGA